MKYNDPIERIKKVNAEIRDLTEMIRNTNNIYVMQNCQLQINEYEKLKAEGRLQNEYSTWKAMQK